MNGASRLTSAQLAAAVERERDGRPDKAAMTNAERAAAGLMTRRQAAEHEHLTILPHERLAERVRGPVPDDIWAAGFNLSDGQVRSAWRQAFATGHGDCGGLHHDSRDGRVLCACGHALMTLRETA